MPSITEMPITPSANANNEIMYTSQDEDAVLAEVTASQSTSFVAAIKQLSAQYQLADWATNPLVVSSTPIFQLHAFAPLAQQSAAPSRGMGPFVRRGQHTLIHPQYYYELATAYTTHVMKDWVPHAMNKDEIEGHRRATLKELSKIRALEAQVEEIAPRQDYSIEQVLFMTRVDFRTRFCRIFRINDLPVEILNNIFSLVVWTAPDSKSAIKWRLYLTSICRSWRSLAIGDPFLWNAVWITDPYPFYRSMAWIERAGDAALDVRFTDDPAHPVTLEAVRYLFDALFQKLSTIRSMVIVVQDWDPALYIVDALRKVASDVLPMILQHFELHRSGSAYVQIGTGYEPNFYTQAMPLFGGAYIPSLDYIALNGVHVDFHNTVMKNLTTIDIRRIPLEKAPTLSRFRGMLKSSPALARLILDGAGPQWPKKDEHVEPVVLPNLQILVLGDFSMQYGSYILSLISAPNVVDLTVLQLLGEDYTTFIVLLQKFALVKSLTLHTSGWHTQSTIAVVQWLHSLKEVVYLRVSGLAKAFFDLFLYNVKTMLPATGPSENIVCPKLAYLEYHDMDTDFLANWVHIRNMLGVPLRKVYIGDVTLRALPGDKYENLLAMSQVLSPCEIQGLPRAHKPKEEQALFAKII